MPATCQDTGPTGRPQAPSSYPSPHPVRSSADFAALSSLQHLSQGPPEGSRGGPEVVKSQSWAGGLDYLCLLA